MGSRNRYDCPLHEISRIGYRTFPGVEAAITGYIFEEQPKGDFYVSAEFYYMYKPVQARPFIICNSSLNANRLDQMTRPGFEATPIRSIYVILESPILPTELTGRQYPQEGAKVSLPEIHKIKGKNCCQKMYMYLFVIIKTGKSKHHKPERVWT